MFVDAFSQMGRGGQFSYQGLQALYDYLQDYTEQTGAEVELDVIALCCDYDEYDSLADVNTNYTKPFASVDELRDHTQVIEIPGTDRLIIQSF